jgi:hypothetical protein
MKSDNLSSKQEAFCEAFVRLNDDVAAYKEVFSTSRVGEKAIIKKTKDLLKLKSIKNRIKELKNINSGRPTLYKEDYNEQVKKLCLLGATDKEISDFLQISESTLNNWKLEYPEFMESIRAGKQMADMEIAHSLYNSAQDRIIPEQQAFKLKKVYYDDNGKRIEEERVEIVEVGRSVPANDRSIQFWLKNRNPDRWKDKHEVEVTNDNMSPEEKAERIAYLKAKLNKSS